MKNKTRILIVDDQYEVRTTNKNFLDLLGFNNYIEAKNGLEALHKIEEDDAEMILCDWNMTPISGYEVLRKVRISPKTLNLPFIMITAEAIQGNIISAIQAGVDGYIVKPYSHITLKEEIKKVSDKFVKRGQQILNSIQEGQGYQAVTPEVKLKLIEAEQLLIVAERICHWSIQPCYALARLYMIEKSYQTALLKIKKAITLDYAKSELHEFAAKCYGAVRDYAKALAEYRSLVNLVPDNPDYYMRVGELALKLEQYEEAVRAFKNCVEASKKVEVNKFLDARRHGKLGEAMRNWAVMKSNDIDLLHKAESSLSKSLKLNPNFVSAHYNIMMAYKAMGRIDAAAKAYEVAQLVSPVSSEDWLELGKAFLEYGNKKKADFAFKNSIRKSVDDDEFEWREAVGKAYLEKGMIDQAINAFGESHESLHDTTRIHNILGIAYRKKKNYGAAIKEYRKILVLEPENEGVLYNMATLFLDMNDKDSARDVLKKALALNSDFEEAKELLSRIEKKECSANLLSL